MRFQSENTFFQFLRCDGDATLELKLGTSFITVHKSVGVWNMSKVIVNVVNFGKCSEAFFGNLHKVVRELRKIVINVVIMDITRLLVAVEFLFSC